jgi:hypothetical protein
MLSASRTAPAQSYEDVTPGDTSAADFAGGQCRGLWVGTGGDVACVPGNGDAAVVFVGVPNGFILPVECIRVNSTGTTASDIVALF